MRLNQLIPKASWWQVVKEFGAAKLIKLPNGRHELIGGTATDLATASEWASLFAHEVVFSQRNHVAIPPRSTPLKLYFRRF